MQWFLRARLAPLFLFGLGLVLLPQLVEAQTAPEKVKFETVDGVELHGTFYASPKGKKAMTVLLLHNPGSDSQKGGWDKLAKDLQAKDFAVLTFDFRGHGNSTGVAPHFWNLPLNRTKVKGFNAVKAKLSINQKDFDRTYFSTLVNDIAAAKVYLDKRNDQGDCNSANLVVVGAQEGATLGAMWMTAEMYRHRMVGPALFQQPDRNPEGNDLAGAVWLSISPNLQNIPVPVDTWLMTVGKEKKVPIGLLYGDGDDKAASFSKRIMDRIQAEKSGLKLTGAQAVKGGLKLEGEQLLNKTINIEDAITGYTDKVFKQHKWADWDNRDVEKRTYIWMTSSSRRPAKTEGEKFLNLLPLDIVGVRQ